jgi:hypothetical protein
VQLAATVDAAQLKVAPQLVVPDALSPVGVDGTAEQALQVPTAVHGWPLPAGPLLVAGFCPCVHQLLR